jgi:hypothetical protein
MFRSTDETESPALRRFLKMSRHEQEQSSNRQNEQANARGVLLCSAISIAKRSEIDEPPEVVREIQTAKKILAHFFSEIDLRNLPFIDAVSISEQKDLIEGLSAFQTQEIDEKILDLLRRSAEIRPTGPTGEFAQYDLANTCLKRLEVRAHQDPTFRKSVIMVLSALNSSSRPSGNLGKTKYWKCLEDALH